MSPDRRRTSIDWAAVRERLARAQAATEAALRPSPEQARRILDERARALVRPAADAEPIGERLDAVVFGLAGERYAIATGYVREVARLTDFTPIPGCPDFVVGVTNLRGSVVMVVDIGRFFDMPRKGLTDLSRIVVLGRDQAEFGVLVDEALGQQALALADILEPPGEVAGIGRDYLAGVTGEALIVLDGAALIDDRRLYVEGEAEADA